MVGLASRCVDTHCPVSTYGARGSAVRSLREQEKPSREARGVHWRSLLWSVTFDDSGKRFAGFLDSGMWDNQWEAFAENYRVIRYDMRGYGKSDPLDAPTSRRAELQQVLTHLGVESAYLVGCSMSGETMRLSASHSRLCRTATGTR